MTAPSSVQDELVPAIEARRDQAPRTEAQRRAAYAAHGLAEAKFRISHRAWSGGTGKHGGPQVGNVAVLAKPPADLPAPRPVGRGEGRPALRLLHTAAAPASLLLPGEWLRRFTSDEAARDWAAREGWRVQP